MVYQITRTRLILGIAVLVIVVLSAWYVISEDRPRLFLTHDPIDDGTGAPTENVAIEEIPVNLDLNADALARPSLNRPVVILNNFSPEVAAIVRGNIEALRVQLEEDPNSFQAWSDLAIQYKVIDDFEGAIEIWEYLSLVAGENTVPRINLGNVYHYELKDFEKSEEAFQKVLAVDSKNVEAYIGLHELYRYSYKQDTTRAVDVVLDAMRALPNDLRLYQTLGNYYQDTGEIDKARETLLLGLDKARIAGDTNLVNTFTSMLELLPR